MFGSTAIGCDTIDSDIDLLVSALSTPTLLTLGAAEHELSEVLGVDVDIVPDNAVRPFMRERILSEAVPLP